MNQPCRSENNGRLRLLLLFVLRAVIAVLFLSPVLAITYLEILKHKGQAKAEVYDKLEKGVPYATVVEEIGEPSWKKDVDLNTVYWRSVPVPSLTPGVLECRWDGVFPISVWFDAEGRVAGKHLW